jgi:major membrane immunogen (membrane-anchored lipoprotein)
MKIFSLRNLACLAAFFVLFACGNSNSNPLIGKWEAQEGDQKATFTFAASEMTVGMGDDLLNGKAEYQKISDKAWEVTMTTTDGDSKKFKFEFSDKDHAFEVDTPEAILTRVK